MVRLEGAERLDGAYQLRVRTESGTLDETLITGEDLAGEPSSPPMSARRWRRERLRYFTEAHPIELACAHDPNFAVSLSGVRGLPHQIVAVYKHMLPQAWLRFVLADDPRAGKTIMAGLFTRELNLRGVARPRARAVSGTAHGAVAGRAVGEVRRALRAACHRVKWQLGGNAWQQNDRVSASLDFAKRDEVMPDLLLADWDLS